jgi:hypothetical protein
VDKLLPMSKDTLKALTQELLMVGVSAGTIKNMWSSIEDRHRRFGFALPLGGPGDFKRLYKAVAAVKGTPSKLIFPIGLHHLKRLLELVGLTVCQERDVLACILGTVVCLRVVEVAFCKSATSCGITMRLSTKCTSVPWQCMSTGGSRIQHGRGFTRAWAWLLVLHGTLRCASDVTRSDTGFGSVSSAQKRSNRVQGADFARLSSPRNAVGSVRC